MLTKGSLFQAAVLHKPTGKELSANHLYSLIVPGGTFILPKVVILLKIIIGMWKQYMTMLCKKK